APRVLAAPAQPIDVAALKIASEAPSVVAAVVTAITIRTIGIDSRRRVEAPIAAPVLVVLLPPTTVPIPLIVHISLPVMIEYLCIGCSCQEYSAANRQTKRHDRNTDSFSQYRPYPLYVHSQTHLFLSYRGTFRLTTTSMHRILDNTRRWPAWE